MDRYEQDANRLLKIIGAWKKYGKKGLDKHPMRESESILRYPIKGKATQSFHFPGLKICYGESESDYFYRSDYGVQKLDLTRYRKQGCKSGVKPNPFANLKPPTRISLFVDGKQVYISQGGRLPSNLTLAV